MRQAPETAPGFAGWRIVWTVSLAQGLGPALLGPAGVFMTPMQDEFGASRAAVSLGGPILASVMLLMGLVLGPRLDRGSIRRFMLVGLAIMAASLIGLSRAGSLQSVGLLLALASVGMSLYGILPAQVLLVNWFTRLRGRALALSTVGMSVSGFLLPPLSALLIAQVGWRDAIALIAATAAMICVVPIARFIVDRPEDLGQHPDGDREGRAVPATTIRRSPRHFLGSGNFWLISLGMGLALASLAVTLHLVPFALSLGFPLQRAAWLPTALSMGSLFGKLLGGYSIDRLGHRITVASLLSVQGIGWILVTSEPGYFGLLASAALIGFGSGGFLPLPPVYLAACFGPRVVGQAVGLSGAATLPLQIAAPLLVGAQFDRVGSYLPAFEAMLGVSFLAAVLLLCVRLPASEPSAD